MRCSLDWWVYFCVVYSPWMCILIHAAVSWPWKLQPLACKSSWWFTWGSSGLQLLCGFHFPQTHLRADLWLKIVPSVFSLCMCFITVCHCLIDAVHETGIKREWIRDVHLCRPFVPSGVMTEQMSMSQSQLIIMASIKSSHKKKKKSLFKVKNYVTVIFMFTI